MIVCITDEGGGASGRWYELVQEEEGGEQGRDGELYPMLISVAYAYTVLTSAVCAG
jgi:hypothetical protein